MHFSAAKLVRVSVLLAATIASAWCWGVSGHRVIALIAEQRLSAPARAELKRLLFNGRYTLAEVSTCADQIRSFARNPAVPPDEACTSMAGRVDAETGAWHYVAIPYSVERGAGESFEKWCPASNCAPAQIERWSNVLRTSSDDAERRRALVFIVHLVADIYQPLHAVDRNCDRGGNRERVSVPSPQGPETLSLHRMWDVALVDRVMASAGAASEQDLASKLLEHSSRRRLRRWEQENVNDVIWQSHRLASGTVYRGIPERNFCNATPGGPSADPVPIPAQYSGAAENVAREQLLKAGVQLAAVLERTLSR